MELKFIARIHLSDSSANEILGRSLLQTLFWWQESLFTKSDAQSWVQEGRKALPGRYMVEKATYVFAPLSHSSLLVASVPFACFG